MLVAALVILAGVVVVASGRGGEMAYEHPDYPPLDLGPVTAADVALLRPPSAAWGYNMRVTDEALTHIARAMSERDVRISSLQQQVDDLRAELSRTSAPWPGARHAAQGPSRAQGAGGERSGFAWPSAPEPAWSSREPAPGEPAPTEGVPGEPAPGEAVPGEAVAGGGAVGGAVAGEPAPGEAALRGTAAGKAVASGGAAGQAAAGEAAADGAAPDEGPAGAAVPGGAVPGAAVPPDDTVADGSIPAVTATDLPRQAAPARYELEPAPPGHPLTERDLADFREVRPAERGDG